MLCKGHRRQKIELIFLFFFIIISVACSRYRATKRSANNVDRWIHIISSTLLYHSTAAIHPFRLEMYMVQYVHDEGGHEGLAT